MRYFAQRYRLAPLGQGGRLIAMAAAHHSLNYIHPFPDGNGRVSRLMSHAMGLTAGIGASGLWKERSARMVLSSLVKDGILGSGTPKGPVSLRFPSHSIDILFPRLFVEG
jgi:hypothetical protein